MAIIWGMSLAVNFRSLIPGVSLDSLDADDLNMLSYPLRGEIDPAAVTALFDFFLDHLLTIDLKCSCQEEERPARPVFCRAGRSYLRPSQHV